jgi:hypothetical protein
LASDPKGIKAMGSTYLNYPAERGSGTYLDAAADTKVFPLIADPEAQTVIRMELT